MAEHEMWGFKVGKSAAGTNIWPNDLKREATRRFQEDRPSAGDVAAEIGAQGSQYTSFVWTNRLRRSGVRISMDGKGLFLPSRDDPAGQRTNIFVERLWRSLKYERVYLHAWETGSGAKAGIRKWMDFYNNKRPYSALGGKPPAVVYRQRNETTKPDQQVQRTA